MSIITFPLEVIKEIVYRMLSNGKKYRPATVIGPLAAKVLGGI